MIRYALACAAGHRFDSWFRDSAGFDAQSAAGRIACPACGSAEVAKTIMAPTVRTKERLVEAPADGSQQVEGGAVTLLDEDFARTRALAQAFRTKVMAEAQDVGRRFAEEARAIHEKRKPPQRIRGEATLGETRDLLEDGILVMPIPALVDECN